MPDFLVTDIKKKKSGNFCVNVWPQGWMAKAYTLMWLAVVVASLVVMIVLYSRVVHTLWFKSNDDNQLTNQQKVSVQQQQLDWYS